MLQHRAKVAEKVGAKNLVIVKRMATKTSKMEARTIPNQAQRAPRWGQDSKKTAKKIDPTKNTLGAFSLAVF